MNRLGLLAHQLEPFMEINRPRGSLTTNTDADAPYHQKIRINDVGLMR